MKYYKEIIKRRFSFSPNSYGSELREVIVYYRNVTIDDEPAAGLAVEKK